MVLKTTLSFAKRFWTLSICLDEELSIILAIQQIKTTETHENKVILAGI
jgi:hypothetical protein